MNERIQELWREAHDYANKQAWVDVTKNVSHIFAEKFAELIVRECAKTIEDVHSKDLGDYLKEVFGVEE